MVEWLNQHVEYWHWIVTGLTLAGLEIFVPSFIILWFGAAAISVGVLMLFFTPSINVQLVIWAGLSVFYLVLWHRLVSPRMADKTFAGLSREALIGQVGTVVSYSAESGKGQLRFPAPIVGSDEWSFICQQPCRPGDRVSVIEISGNDLVVKPV